MANEVTAAIDAAFRDYATAGVPSSGANKVKKDEVRAVGPIIDQLIAAARDPISGTSSTSITYSTGTKSFTTQPTLAFDVGRNVEIVSAAAPTVDKMYGVVTAYNSTTGAITVEVDFAPGSGSHTDNIVRVTGPRGGTGSSGAAGASRAINVVAATFTQNGNSGTIVNGATFGGTVLSTGQLVMLAGQSNPAQNGIYVVAASGSASRSSDFSTFDSHVGAIVVVQGGTFKDRIFKGTSSLGGVLGTNPIVFTDIFDSINIPGTPTATTASNGTSTTQIATTAFVAAGFAPLASPALTGAPTAPTPALDNYSTALGTTAYAMRAAWVELYGSAPASAIAALSPIPDRARRKLIADTINMIPDAIWTKLDYFYLRAGQAAQHASINWKNPALYVGGVVNALSFAGDEGYTGDGVGYLTTGFVPSTAGGNWTLNSAACGAWFLDDVSEASPGYGCLTSLGMIINPRNTSNQLSIRINDGTSSTVGNANGSGHYAASRTGINEKKSYKDGIVVGNFTTTSGSLPADQVTPLKSNSSRSTRTIAADWGGGGMSAEEIRAIDAALYHYLVNVEAVEPRVSYVNVKGLWAGCVKQTSFKVCADLPDGDYEATLVVSTSPDATGIVYESGSPLAVTTVADSAGKPIYMVSDTATGLTAFTAYWYTIKLSLQGVDLPIDPASWHKIRRTAPVVGTAVDFTRILASCFRPTDTSVLLSPESAAARNPHMVQMLGDNPYSNIATDNLALKREYDRTKYRYNVSLQALMAAAPFDESLDDHDYGGNDCDYNSNGGLAGTTVFPNAIQSYRESRPHYDLADAAHNPPRLLARAFPWGRLHVICLDSRAQRSSGTTVLGTGTVPPNSFDQLAWYKAQIIYANTAVDGFGAFLFDRAVISIPTGIPGAVYDGWREYSAADFAAFCTWVRDNALIPVDLECGDIHMTLVDDGTNLDYATGGGFLSTLCCSSPFYNSSTLTGGGPGEWNGVDTSLPGNGRTYISKTHYQSGNYWIAEVYGRTLTGTVVMEKKATYDSRDLINAISFTTPSSSAGVGGGVMSIQLEMAKQGSNRLISVDWTSSDGQSGTVYFLPNKKFSSFNWTKPAIAGVYTFELSNPVGCTISGAGTATRTLS